MSLNILIKDYFLANVEQNSLTEKFRAKGLLYFYVLLFLLTGLLNGLLLTTVSNFLLNYPLMATTFSPFFFSCFALYLIRKGGINLLVNLSVIFILLFSVGGLLLKVETETAPYFLNNIFYMLIGLGFVSLFGKKGHVIWMAFSFHLFLPLYFTFAFKLLNPLLYQVGLVGVISGGLCISLLSLLSYLNASIRDDTLLKVEQETRKGYKLNSDLHKLAVKRKQDLDLIQEKFENVNRELQLADENFNIIMEKTKDYEKETLTIIREMIERTDEGRIIMKSVVTSVESIESANVQLNNIIEIFREIFSKTGVINEIVFETKILSFNAAIEAARAGEEGRGFAVVAEEVGHLALKSGEASQQITSLLEDSRNRVNEIILDINKQSKKAQEVSSSSLEKYAQIAQNISTLHGKIEQVKEASNEQERIVKSHFASLRN